MFCFRYVGFGILTKGCWELNWKSGLSTQGFVSYGVHPLSVHIVQTHNDVEYDVMGCVIVLSLPVLWVGYERLA